MKQINCPQTLQNRIREHKTAGDSVALVPTMGFLHEGHLELMQRARQQAEQLIVSIFVNPIQFGPNEDLDRYPRDLSGDLEKCERIGVDYVFTPAIDDLYPEGFQTAVKVSEVSQGLCGAGRPGHFQGVTTVVAKLFNITLPDLAVFGEKDYQQLAVIRRMAQDLNFPIEIIGVPTVRESDGLAMSSRNAYLPAEARAQAPAIYKALLKTRDLYRGGLDQAPELEKAAAQELQKGITLPHEVEYLEIRDANFLERINGEIKQPAVVLAAVHLGGTRLIDNLKL